MPSGVAAAQAQPQLLLAALSCLPAASKQLPSCIYRLLIWCAAQLDMPAVAHLPRKGRPFTPAGAFRSAYCWLLLPVVAALLFLLLVLLPLTPT